MKYCKSSIACRMQSNHCEPSQVFAASRFASISSSGCNNTVMILRKTSDFQPC